MGKTERGEEGGKQKMRKKNQKEKKNLVLPASSKTTNDQRNPPFNECEDHSFLKIKFENKKTTSFLINFFV